MTAPTSPGRFPDCVPTLVDPDRSVVLRAHEAGDLPLIVEQSRDPESQRWTTVPVPPGGYSLDDARGYALDRVPAGWASGTALGWAVEATIDERRRFCGSISLRLRGNGLAEVAFGLHPAARGRGVMGAALRLVRDYGFDVCGLDVLRWHAQTGNWASRRVAAAAGFQFDGTVRRLLPRRGQLVDGWSATITSTDPRVPQPWLHVPQLASERLRLRPFATTDVPAVVEACSDARTAYWLASLSVPYREDDARGYLEAVQELSASCLGLNWCVADPATDRCLGSISLEGFGGYSRRTEIGYWTHPAARGRGLMTEAVRLVTAHAESSRLTDSVMIRCAATNSASRHVAEAAGFQLVGVLPRAEPVRDATLLDLALYSRP